MAVIDLDFVISENDIDIAFDSETEVDLDFGFDAVYTGSYEPSSSLEEQTLDTANKRMIKDITIKPIHTSKMTNPKGGYTVTIG